MWRVVEPPWNPGQVLQARHPTIAGQSFEHMPAHAVLPAISNSGAGIPAFKLCCECHAELSRVELLGKLAD